jgi:hypothetical protein
MSGDPGKVAIAALFGAPCDARGQSIATTRDTLALAETANALPVPPRKR